MIDLILKYKINSFDKAAAVLLGLECDPVSCPYKIRGSIPFARTERVPQQCLENGDMLWIDL